MNPYPIAPFAICLAITAWTGCAASPTPREQRLSEGFAAIQVQEATIARAATQAGQPGDCGVRCAAHGELCQAAERVCELADELQDADALARCGQATESCDGSRPDCECN